MNIKDFMVVDETHTLLDGAGSEAVGLYIAVERKLASINAPDLSWRMETGETGLLKALVGKRRTFLCVESARFREYNVLISSRAYGSALHISWTLLVTPRFANDLRRAVRLDGEGGGRFDIGAEHDFLDRLDLDAYLSTTRLVVKTAIREITGSDEGAVGPVGDPGPPGDGRGRQA